MRRLLAGIVLAGLGAAIVWATGDLAPFGTPPDAPGEVVRALVGGRHAANTVMGVTFDLRGLDTLGEELILFAAALGAAVLLRHTREPADEERDGGAGIAEPLQAAGAALVGPLIVLGVYVVTHGHLGPGGGFQGGVILAGGLLLVYAAGQVVALRRVEPLAFVEAADATGALAYALVALGGLVFAGGALVNFLPLGSTGELLSAGTIPVLSVAVGVEVTGALALILTEFLDQTLLERPE